MNNSKKELLFGLDDENVSLVERLFKADMKEFCEKLIDLKPGELFLSAPINVGFDQYLFIITKSDEGMGSCITKFCKGPSFNEALKEIKDRPSIGRVGNTFVGTVSINGFFNKCLVMNGLYDVEYKAFKEFVKTDLLFWMIQDYALGEDKKGAKTLKDYIKFRLKEQMMNAYSMVEGVRG